MKKLLALLLVACAVTLSGCLYLPQTTTITSTTSEKQPGKPNETLISIVETDDSETSDVPEEIGTSTEPEVEGEKLIEIVKEYTYVSEFWYTYHLVVVKNIGNVPLSIDTNTLAYGVDGSLISVGSGGIDVIDAGCTALYCEMFETTDKISKYETTRTVKRPVYYSYGAANLSYTATDIKNGKIIQVTNNGNETLHCVQGYLLFFKNGKLVDWESDYFSDSDYEVKPNAIISVQYNSYEEFDSIEFYLSARG